ncbi:UNVERIFIED_CONTAM: Beta-glucosidase BoGH3B [Sesamum latifolium]|uniref:beta-glucosidase n=1 Tax=Sesamum latifolium TaxID=2727402 RepID=A0AAW2Y2I8_9LAMI
MDKVCVCEKEKLHHILDTLLSLEIVDKKYMSVSKILVDQHGRVTAAALVALWLWTAVVEAGYTKYKDPKQPLNVRIKDLISRMTLEEKIGQMTQIERKVASADVIKKYFIGSIVSGGGSVPGPRASAENWINMVNEFQKGALSTRLGIPMIYGIDAVHGHNNAYNATIFPHNVGLGVTRQVRLEDQPDPELVKRIGAATALEVRATGIHYTFAPCIAVCRDPRWGRCYESYSEDHQIVQSMTEIIPGLQGDVPSDYPKNFPFVNPRTKVAACAKHFVGDGGTTDGINENNTVIDWNGLLNIHMPAYLDSIRKGVATVMVSYSSWNGKKMHANYDLITGYLKKKLKFKGFVISDMWGIDRITTPSRANYTYSVQAGIHAGIDMVMVPEEYVEFIDDLTLLVKKNVIPMSRINDAVRRILRVKFIMGLFENPMADLSLADQLGSQDHRELAREAVRKSLVLLKNGKNSNEPLLPLPTSSKKILVAGSHANDIGNQCGGWTIEWNGQTGNITVGTTILTAVKNSVDGSTEVVYNESPEAEFLKANNFSYAIVVVGELPYVETKGDSKNLTIAEPGYSTIINVCESVKCVVIIISGRPVYIEPYLEKIDALVAAWLPGTEGQGITDVLFGEYGFTGKLARTWFRTVGQLPMNIGDPHYDPLFPFGYGLTTSPRLLKASQ